MRITAHYFSGLITFPIYLNGINSYHEIYNWDETCYQIGQGKQRKVITSRTTSYIATRG